MKKPLVLRIKERANTQQVVILALMLIPDSIAIALSAVTAYISRFPESKKIIEGEPAIAQFEYRGILVALVIAWIFVLIATGTYRFNHATLVIFNLRLVIKRSFTYFFFLGFVSFSTEDSSCCCNFVNISFCGCHSIESYGAILKCTCPGNLDNSCPN